MLALVVPQLPSPTAVLISFSDTATAKEELLLGYFLVWWLTDFINTCEALSVAGNTYIVEWVSITFLVPCISGLYFCGGSVIWVQCA